MILLGHRQYCFFVLLGCRADAFARYYNKTKYSGLETHIANSYANPLLQLYRFTPMLRNLALHHTASSCLFETCLLCEMGFLFDMLEKASGQNCQATNLLKTFSSLSHGDSLSISYALTFAWDHC